MIYLDNNSTTAVAPEVAEAMEPYLADGRYGNPSSPYRFGQEAAAALTQARQQVARLIGANPEMEREVIFTSCASESITSVFRSAVRLFPERKRLVVSAVEHAITLNLCEELETELDYRVTRVPVDGSGHLDIEALETALNDKDDPPALASIMWANNETGVIFPVQRISELCRGAGVPLHCDAVQAVGKLPVNVSALPGISYLSLSGHKMHAPKGIGALYISRRSRYKPLLPGSQQSNRRAGTENMASIVGFGKAAEMAVDGLKSGKMERVAELRDELEKGILQNIRDTEIIGGAKGAERIPNTAKVLIYGAEAEGLLMMLDQAGINVSTGSACTTGSLGPSHVLTAMGLSEKEAKSCLRLSLSRFTTREEIYEVLEILPGLVERMRALFAGAAK